jgi:hypothetical protein
VSFAAIVRMLTCEIAIMDAIGFAIDIRFPSEVHRRE